MDETRREVVAPECWRFERRLSTVFGLEFPSRFSLAVDLRTA